MLIVSCKCCEMINSRRSYIITSIHALRKALPAGRKPGAVFQLTFYASAYSLKTYSLLLTTPAPRHQPSFAFQTGKQAFG